MNAAAAATTPRKGFDVKQNFYIGSIGALSAFVAAVPHSIRNYIALIFILVTVDTVTGVLGAIACREMRSSHMRQKLFTKSLQYAGFFTLGFVATILSESWIFMTIVCGGIMAAEVSSMIENFAKMQTAGVSLGPFNHAVSLLSGFFTIATTEKHTVVATATVIPPNPESQPTISTTTIESIGKPGYLGERKEP